MLNVIPNLQNKTDKIYIGGYAYICICIKTLNKNTEKHTPGS